MLKSLNMPLKNFGKAVSAIHFLGKVKDKYFNGRFNLIRLYKFIIPMQISYFHYAINSCKLRLLCNGLRFTCFDV